MNCTWTSIIVEMATRRPVVIWLPFLILTLMKIHSVSEWLRSEHFIFWSLSVCGGLIYAPCNLFRLYVLQPRDTLKIWWTEWPLRTWLLRASAYNGWAGELTEEDRQAFVAGRVLSILIAHAYRCIVDQILQVLQFLVLLILTDWLTLRTWIIMSLFIMIVMCASFTELAHAKHEITAT